MVLAMINFPLLLVKLALSTRLAISKKRFFMVDIKRTCC